jgi:two-component system chemotaxis sensor kinase CheA
MNREEQFTKLAELLARYEPGDLLLLSDLADAVRELEPLYTTSPVCVAFLGRLGHSIDAGMRTLEDGDLPQSWGGALDLLQKWTPGLREEPRQRLEARMAGFFPGESDAISPASVPQPASPPATKDAFLSDETFAIFLTEARERLAHAQELILDLEEHPADADALAALFRAFHTIKGESGFLHLRTLGELTHRLETLLDLARNGRLIFSRPLADLLLAGVDRSREILDTVEAGNRDPGTGPGLEAFLESLNTFVAQTQTPLGTVLVQEGKLHPTEVERVLDQQRQGNFQQKFGELAVDAKLISHKELHEALDRQVPASKAAEPTVEEVIKVRMGKVNFLVDMIGELTIALGQVTGDSVALSQVRKITRSLQLGAMELRTDTMQGLFSTARRIIRDLSHKLGKPVTVKTEGDRLEIDRSLIKALEEPLMHLVRNSLDHGLEPTADRVAAGKPEAGAVTIEAVRRGSTIHITVADDGRGLDRGKILAKAISRGLVSAEAAASLSDAQIHDFIFHPGFSTSDAVSQVSGRGVGMDIVRSMVTASRGTLRLQTVPGQGTSFFMTFPISTAIIDGLIVRVGVNNLIVPTGSVVQSLKLPEREIYRVNGRAELVTIREVPMPVLRLDRVLGMVRKRETDGSLGIARDPGGPEGPSGAVVGLIVENADRQSFFLVVDEVLAKKEVVVKPLGPRFRAMRGITAGAVLAGGTIGLVLDVDQVAALDL